MGHLGYCCLLVFVNNAAVNICLQISFQVLGFSSLGYKSRNGIAESHGNSILNFLRNLQTVFHRGYTILQPYQQCPRGLFSPYLWQRLLLSAFALGFDSSNPNGCEVISHYGLTYISLMMTDFECLFICLLTMTIYVSSLEKCLFKLFAYFVITLFGFFLLD